MVTLYHRVDDVDTPAALPTGATYDFTNRSITLTGGDENVWSTNYPNVVTGSNGVIINRPVYFTTASFLGEEDEINAAIPNTSWSTATVLTPGFDLTRIVFTVQEMKPATPPSVAIDADPGGIWETSINDLGALTGNDIIWASYGYSLGGTDWVFESPFQFRGVNGADAKSLRLSLSNDNFILDANDQPKFLSITATAVSQNLDQSSSPVFTMDVGDGNGYTALNGAGLTRTVNYALDRPYYRVRVEWDSLVEEEEIRILQDGSDVIVGSLTNDSATVPSDFEGTYPAGLEVTTTLNIFRGSSDITGDYDTIGATVVPALGATYSLVGGLLTVTNMPSEVDQAVITIEATDATLPTRSKDFVITKVKDGPKGDVGPDPFSVYVTPQVVQVPYYSGVAEAISGSCAITVLQGSTDLSLDYTLAQGDISASNLNGNFSPSLLSLSYSNVSMSGGSVKGSVSLTVRSANAAYPDLTVIVEFQKIIGGTQGPGITYIGEFNALESGRAFNNNSDARDIVSNSGTYYIFSGTNGTIKTAAGIPPNAN